MKTIKFLLWLIILTLLGLLIYQNLDYFLTAVALKLDLKVAAWHWTLPELQTIAYLGICFALGLILAGTKGMAASFRSKKELQAQEKTIAGLKQEINDLKTELDVFIHDPYIKKAMDAASDKAGTLLPKESEKKSETDDGAESAE